MAIFNAPDGTVSHEMVLLQALHIHPVTDTLLGYTSPSVMFSSARKREFLNDAETINKESIDDYFLCLIMYKNNITKNRLQRQKLWHSGFVEPVLLSSFNSVYFLLRHILIYGNILTTGPQPLLEQ